jgi:hypothetical protein
VRIDVSRRDVHAFCALQKKVVISACTRCARDSKLLLPWTAPWGQGEPCVPSKLDNSAAPRTSRLEMHQSPLLWAVVPTRATHVAGLQTAFGSPHLTLQSAFRVAFSPRRPSRGRHTTRSRPWSACASSASPEPASTSLAAGKVRARRALLRDLPRILDGARGHLELTRGGDEELFAPDVSFSFPAWPSGGRGRRKLKLLLASLALQARCGTMEPRVERVVVDSPMPDLLVAKYVVSCCTFAEEEVEQEEGSFSGAAGVDEEIYETVRTELHVRSRIQFDSDGRIVGWHDAWDRSLPQFLREVMDFGDYSGAEEDMDDMAGLEPTTNMQQNRSPSDRGDEDTEGRHSQGTAYESSGDTPQPWDVSEIFDMDVYCEDGRLDPARLTSRARDLADTLEGGPELCPDELQKRMEDVKRYLAFEVTKSLLPGSEPVDYSLFHTHAIFETPFVLSQGVDSLEFVHKAMRLDAIVRYSTISLKCIALQQPGPRLITATYLVTARNRLGRYVRRRLRCQFFLNRSGQIVHEVDTVDEATELFASPFRRTGDRLWIW